MICLTYLPIKQHFNNRTQVTITLERLRKRGYESMLDIYKQITPVRRDSLFPIT